MSAVDVREGAEPPASEALLARPKAFSTRFFRSELMLIFGRRRNWLGLAILAAMPLIIAISTKLSNDSGGSSEEDGPNFFANITSNGLFVALAALTVELPIFLPLAIAAISGDSIAGEANLGTLRNLLAVPVHRTRMLAVKYAALVVFSAAATFLVAFVGAGAGLVLFGGGPLTLLSGTQIGFGEGLLRLLLVCLYVTACLSALAAFGLFVSTLTEQPIGAAIATLIFAITSQIANVIPQLDWLHPYLIVHHWLGFGDLLRSPISTETVGPGLWSAFAYTLVFLAASWARFENRDVTS